LDLATKNGDFFHKFPRVHWWIQRLLGISPNSLGVDPWITLLGISHKKYRELWGYYWRFHLFNYIYKYVCGDDPNLHLFF
jgi:hypothetical protein